MTVLKLRDFSIKVKKTDLYLNEELSEDLLLFIVEVQLCGESVLVEVLECRDAEEGVAVDMNKVTYLKLTNLLIDNDRSASNRELTDFLYENLLPAVEYITNNDMELIREYWREGGYDD